MQTSEKFKIDTFSALKDEQLRSNFRKATDGLVEKRINVFQDFDEWQTLRNLGYSSRKKTLDNLPDILEKLESNCKKNSIHVHWAENTIDANSIVLKIAKNSGVEKVVKGKSMVSEEMGLNQFLQKNGIEILESDLGEFIIQLENELPSHIIMPAIHKNKYQISKIFYEKVDQKKRLDTAEEMTLKARKILREKFYNADMGVSGVNFAVAETGTICLVENEGNGRFCTTLPPIHVAVMGIEKVVEKLNDIPPLLSLLTRSATGQDITTYFNMITSPRKLNERDGPKEVHLILLDNGRTRMFEDKLLRDTLLCIRCGACMNHCPVYSRIGGHAYNSIYPGPIGKIITPQINDLNESGHLADASSLCGACVEVCPVKIPITNILLRLRHKKLTKKLKFGQINLSGWKHLKLFVFWKIWLIVFSNPKLYKLKSFFISKTISILPKWLPIISEWTLVRTLPKFPNKSLHILVKEKGISEE